MAIKEETESKAIAAVLGRDYSTLGDEQCAFAFLSRSEKYVTGFKGFVALPNDAQEAIQDANFDGRIAPTVEVGYLSLVPTPIRARTFGEWSVETNERLKAGEVSEASSSVRDELLPEQFQLLRWVDPKTSPWDEALKRPLFWRHNIPIFARFTLEELPRGGARADVRLAKSDRANVWGQSLRRGKPKAQIDDSIQRQSEVAVVFNLLDPVEVQVAAAVDVLKRLQAQFKRKHDAALEDTVGNRETGYGCGRYGVFLEALDLADAGHTREQLSKLTRIRLRTLNDRIAKGKKMVEEEKWREILGLLS